MPDWRDKENEGLLTGRRQEVKDARKEGCWKGERKEMSDSGKEFFKERWDSGKEG